MNKTISQLQKLALLAAGLAASTGTMAWGQQLYQTHTDGSIWEYTGVPCNRTGCTGWIELDNNPKLNMIAAGGGALFELHQDGSIWWYVGPACSGGHCPGWVELDNNPQAVAIGVGSNNVYEVHSDSSLWEFNGVVCSGGYCPGWTELSDEPQFVWFGANSSLLVGEDDHGGLYQLAGGFDNWVPIDSGVQSYMAGFAVGGNAVYDRLVLNGELRQAVATLNSWVPIDYNTTTISVTAGSSVYQARGTYDPTEIRSIWQYTDTPCAGKKCPGWVKIDNYTASQEVVAGANTVYQLRSSAGDTSIWQYTGKPCRGKVCRGWVKLDDNPSIASIVAGPQVF